MSQGAIKKSPATPIIGLSDNYFSASPHNSSIDRSFECFKQQTNNLRRSFSPNVSHVASPNISPIMKKMGSMTICEEPEDHYRTTFLNTNEMERNFYGNSDLNDFQNRCLGIPDGRFQENAYNNDKRYNTPDNNNNSNMHNFNKSPFVELNQTYVLDQMTNIPIRVSEVPNNFGTIIDDEAQYKTPENQNMHGQFTANENFLRPHKPVKFQNATEEYDQHMYRRSLFLLPSTPTTSQNRMDNSNFEHSLSVNTILKEIGLSKYIDLFLSEEINIPVFLTLNKSDLESIGIYDSDDQMEIMRGVESYQFLK